MKREDFDKIKQLDAKLGILFEEHKETRKTLQDNVDAINKRFEAGSDRFKKIENRKRVDQTKSVAGGFLGGFVAMILKTAFWK